MKMPNLVGIWKPAANEEAIRAMLGKQLHRVCVANVHYDEYVAAYPGFGMALQDHGLLENGPQPVWSEDGRFCLLFDGELYNAEDLIRRFRRDLPEKKLSTPELCLRLIGLHGTEVVNQFNGLFVLVMYDRRDRRATFISDRYGFRPLYYVQRSKALIFGSELKALCVADPERRQINEVGLLEFFCYGSHISERTWMKEYLRLPPATILTVDENRVQSRTYWLYKYNESASTLDQATYVTVFSTLLDRAVERCMRGSRRIGIFLSGGYDSRAVAAAIRKHHLPIPAFTFGNPESRDVRFAAMLAQRLGLEHFPLTDRGPYLYPHCRPIVWRTEGMSSFANTTSLRYHPVLKQKADILLTGFLAEFGGSHTWPQLLTTRSRQGVMKAIFDRMIGDRLETARRIFNPQAFARALEPLRNHFQQSFENVPNAHPMNMADCWNLIHIQPRSTYHSPSVDRYAFEVRAPHMDAELVDSLLRIPPRERLEQRVYKKMIAYSFPAIRDVPCTNSGRPINPHFVREYAAMMLRYLGRKATAPLRKLAPVKPSMGREFRDLDEDFRAEPALVDNILRPLLQADIFPEPIFNRAAIEAMIGEHYEKGARHEAVLSRLISWGLAAKYFLHDDLSDVPADIYTP